MDVNKVGDRGGNMSFTKAGLRTAQITPNFHQMCIQNTVAFIIDGVFGALAPVDNQAFSTGHANVPACNVCFFAMWVNNTNVVATTQAKSVDASKLGGTGGTSQLAIPMPDVVSNNALIGLIKVKAGVGVTFTPGTTNLNATNITATFFDCAVMPSNPFQS